MPKKRVRNGFLTSIAWYVESETNSSRPRLHEASIFNDLDLNDWFSFWSSDWNIKAWNELELELLPRQKQFPLGNNNSILILIWILKDKNISKLLLALS